MRGHWKHTVACIILCLALHFILDWFTGRKVEALAARVTALEARR